jgi:hypothetical protein
MCRSRSARKLFGASNMGGVRRGSAAHVVASEGSARTVCQRVLISWSRAAKVHSFVRFNPSNESVSAASLCYCDSSALFFYLLI